jgi:hypothetical protein
VTLELTRVGELVAPAPSLLVFVEKVFTPWLVQRLQRKESQGIHEITHLLSRAIQAAVSAEILSVCAEIHLLDHDVCHKASAKNSPPSLLLQMSSLSEAVRCQS